MGSLTRPGSPLPLFAVTLGCPKNRVDTETALASLASAVKLELVDRPEEARLILINTCAFIEEAVSESIDTILSVAHSIEGQERTLAVGGCLVNRYGTTLEKELPEVDIFLTSAELTSIGRILFPGALSGGGPARILSTPPWTAYLKVSEGCSHRCTYCLIPRLRGPRQSRPLDALVEEAAGLEAKGVKELILVAQDLTDYRHGGAGLPELLQALLSSTSIPWIRLLYLNPSSIDSRLVSMVAGEERICSYFDIPIQHASARVLRRMGRLYGPEQVDRIVEEVRKKVEDAVIRTSVMVGFPGETEKEFRELLNALERWEFDHLGCFVYSDEDEAPSHALDSKVEPELARQRMEEVMELQAGISRRRNRRWLGRRLEVLVEGPSEETELLLAGRTRFQAPEIDGITYINRGQFEAGEIAVLEVEEAHTYDLVAGRPGA